MREGKDGVAIAAPWRDCGVGEVENISPGATERVASLQSSSRTIPVNTGNPFSVWTL
jgi:hypothetical protein